MFLALGMLGSRLTKGFWSNFTTEFTVCQADELKQKKEICCCVRAEPTPPSSVAAVQTHKVSKKFWKVWEVSVQTFLFSTQRAKSLFMTRKLRLPPIPLQGDSAPDPQPPHHPYDEGLSWQGEGSEGRDAVALGGQELPGNGTGPLDVLELRVFAHSSPGAIFCLSRRRVGRVGRRGAALPWQRSKADVKTLKRFACGPSTGTWCEIHISSHCFRGMDAWYLFSFLSQNTPDSFNTTTDWHGITSCSKKYSLFF